MSGRIGTAGWSIPKPHAAAFPGAGSHLQRYAARLNSAEINSSFYRPHRPATYARWAASVPDDFRFAVKLPRAISHEAKLAGATDRLAGFLAEIGPLGARLGPLLVQLPPRLGYEAAVADAFFADLRARFDGDVVVEPRHASWFTDAVDTMLASLRIARVAADPAPVPRAAAPGGWNGLVYRRLHGSPDMYYSAYSAEALDGIAAAMRAEMRRGQASWCIFDNTARGEAAGNALQLRDRHGAPPATT